MYTRMECLYNGRAIVVLDCRPERLPQTGVQAY